MDKDRDCKNHTQDQQNDARARGKLPNCGSDSGEERSVTEDTNERG
jgi:hypothetical protein